MSGMIRPGEDRHGSSETSDPSPIACSYLSSFITYAFALEQNPQSSEI